METCSYFRSHIGKTRTENQDWLKASDKDQIFIIADGMGGLPHGDEASRLATDKMYDLLKDRTKVKDYYNDLLHAIIATNQHVYLTAQLNYPGEKIGTTLTALSFSDYEYYIAHIGDSRCYLYRNNELGQITKDQTVKEQIIKSTLEYSQKYLNSKKHILTQALGINETCTPMIYHSAVFPGDIFLLCTDGLYNLFSNGFLTETLHRFEARLPDLPDYLLINSLKNERTDNISFIIVKVENND